MERFTKKARLVECESLNNVHVIENSKKGELKHKTKTSCDFNRKSLMWQTDGTRQKQKQYNNNDAYQQISEKKKNWNIENS